MLSTIRSIWEKKKKSFGEALFKSMKFIYIHHFLIGFFTVTMLVNYAKKFISLMKFTGSNLLVLHGFPYFFGKSLLLDKLHISPKVQLVFNNFNRDLKHVFQRQSKKISLYSLHNYENLSIHLYLAYHLLQLRFCTFTEFMHAPWIAQQAWL